MKIDVVSHCYAAELPQYADALHYQLSSLILDRPRACHVTATICYDPDDEATVKTLTWFWDEKRDPDIRLIPLPPEQLGRRAIGRNIAALSTDADLVWFADVDMAFREGVLDQLASMEWPEGASMIFPRWIQIHRNHAIGARCLLRARDAAEPLDVDPEEFKPKRYARAIGGVQIVRGDLAREHGYLSDHPRWSKPVEKPFGSFRDDIAYRKQCLEHGSIVAVDLPGIHRLRHKVTSYQ
jgi:hypothetical protein